MNSARNAYALTVLPEIFHDLTDPRDPRGVRHHFAALCSPVFLGMLAQIIEMAVLVRWAETHWNTLKEPLGLPCFASERMGQALLYLSSCEVPGK